MEEKYILKPQVKYLSFAAIAVGVISIAIGILQTPARAWTSYLIANYYFISIGIGAMFFLAIQSISQSGWSAAFKRIPEAMGSYLPVAGIFMLLLYFGFKYLYPWADSNLVNADELIKHKSPYMNVGFWLLRVVLFFGIWMLLNFLIRKESLKEDIEGGFKHFNQTEFLSKIYIFVMALTFSLGTFDWIMSIDIKWFSTIYAVMNFISGFHHAVALIGLVIIILNRKGYFKMFNDSHLYDFSKYLFVLAIIWGYFWFCQYLLMWYANIPEETIYYIPRVEGVFKEVFFLSVALNFAVPFLVMLSLKARRSKLAYSIVAILMLIGLWVDLYTQVVPGSIGTLHIGFIEIGAFIGFAGLFAFLFLSTFSKAASVPFNHPYLSESLAHHE